MSKTPSIGLHRGDLFHALLVVEFELHVPESISFVQSQPVQNTMSRSYLYSLSSFALDISYIIHVYRSSLSWFCQF
jgi:hypothetical protein